MTERADSHQGFSTLGTLSELVLPRASENLSETLGAPHQNHVGHLSKIHTISDPNQTLEIGINASFSVLKLDPSLPHECQASFLLHFSNRNKSISINRYQYFILSTTDYSHGHITLHTFLKNGHENLKVSWTGHF